MGSVAASGGYLVATAGQKIIAEPSTITGSIGVFGILPTFQGALSKVGLTADGIKTTPLSGAARSAARHLARVRPADPGGHRRFLPPVHRSGRSGARADAGAGGSASARAGSGTATPRASIGLVDGFGGTRHRHRGSGAKLARSWTRPRSIPVYIEEEPQLSSAKLAESITRGRGQEADRAGCVQPRRSAAAGAAGACDSGMRGGSPPARRCRCAASIARSAAPARRRRRPRASIAQLLIERFAR